MNFDHMKGVSSNENWCVIIQSFPSKLRKELVKQVADIFGLDKKDAEQAFRNTPLILLDGLSFSTAARIKNFFAKVGANVETTSHEMIKKNCYQILWSEMPDLSFFLKDEAPAAGARPAKPAPVLPATPEKATKPEESSPAEKPPVPAKHAFSFLRQQTPEPAPATAETPARSAPKPAAAPEPAPEPKADTQEQAVTPEPASLWEKRAKELSSRLAKIQDEKQQQQQQQQIQASREQDRLKEDMQAKLAAEKQQAEQPAQEREQAQSSPGATEESAVREAERAKEQNEALLQTIKDLETRLGQKDSDLRTAQQRLGEFTQKEVGATARADQLQKTLDEKNAAITEGENLRAALQQEISQLTGKVGDLDGIAKHRQAELESMQAEVEKLCAKHDEERRALQSQTGDLNKKIEELEAVIREKQSSSDEIQRTIDELRSREAELQQQNGSLVHALNRADEMLRARESEMKERDRMLDEFEKKIGELIQQNQEVEAMRRENARFDAERSALLQEFESRFAEQEARILKVEEESRRARSRVERKLTAANRELGEWARGVEALKAGLQKLALFLVTDAPEVEKKSPLRASAPSKLQFPRT
jgi:chromosome segregation ATPase